MDRTWVRLGTVNSPEYGCKSQMAMLPPCLGEDGNGQIIATRECTILAAVATGECDSPYLALSYSPGDKQPSINNDPSLWFAIFGPNGANGTGTSLQYLYTGRSKAMRKLRSGDRLWWAAGTAGSQRAIERLITRILIGY